MKSYIDNSNLRNFIINTQIVLINLDVDTQNELQSLLIDNLYNEIRLDLDDELKDFLYEIN